MKKIIGLIVLAACLSNVTAADKGDAPSYTLRTDQDLRDRFGPSSATITSLSFDLTYAELSAAQQMLFKHYYVAMGEQDEPPYPVDGLKAIYQPITQAQARLGMQGQLDAEVTVADDGVPMDVKFYRSPNAALTKFVANLAMITRFKPGLCNGQPCKMGFPIRVTFVMQ
ncbi:MAG: energy transducer TonB [Pseudomonadota bacterium]|nr:energy transducer TonB [Pseudomonadota bacterium]